MKSKLLLSIMLLTQLLTAQTAMTPSSTAITYGSDWSTVKITADGALNYPWEITYGPDNTLWVTERVGEKIVKVSTATATNAPLTMIDLSAKIANAKQGGLMGMAIHPALYQDINTTVNNYVFISYTYDDGGELKLRIARLIYDNATQSLSEDTSLNVNGAILEDVPASADHNSGRLIFGPDLKLYYTIGDQGANQFDYSCNPVLSQVLPSYPADYDNYPGKTLRLNTDGTIPSDNPYLSGVQSHVYTYGHRNAQGIIFSQDGTLYASEHGPKTDDEINVIKPGKNYGWPEIAGYYDNLAYTYCNWSSLGGSCNAGDFSDHNCPNGAATATEYESYPSAAPSNFEPPIGTYNSTIASDPSGGWFTWPTPAPSSIDIHEANNIPGWGRSLLVPSLKKGTIYRAKLTPDGEDIVSDFYEEFHSSNDRYRDIAISPDGLTIYAVTDNGGGTSGPSSNSGVSIDNPGVIIKIQYQGPLVINPPVANCQDITVTLDATGNTQITPADVDNGSTGGSAGIASLVIDQDTFNCTHTDNPQTVWLTVTDNNGNESRCSAQVTVVPNSNPASFVAPVLEDVVSNCEITVPAPSLINNACAEVIATTTDQVTFTAGQSGVITWVFDDGTYQDTATQNVTVNTLAVPSNINVIPGTTTAFINWDLINGVTYNVRYREVGASTWVTQTTSTNSITLTGLNMLTNYEVQVNSDCGSSQSTYSTIVNFTTTDITYVTPTVSYYPDDFYINNFEILDNNYISLLSNSSNQNEDVSGYSNHTDDGLNIPDLKQLDQFNVVISLVNTHPWNKTSGHSVWIDYNQDGDFDDSNERVWGTTNGDDLFPHGDPGTGSFTVPSTALLGNTRMRIASRTYWTPNDPEAMTYDGNNGGEYEDYTVNITSNTLSVPQIELSKFSIYPNPIQNSFTVKFSRSISEDVTITLTDLQGRVIKVKTLSKSNDQLTFDNTNYLKSGVYFVTISNNQKVLKTKKLIKL